MKPVAAQARQQPPGAAGATAKAQKAPKRSTARSGGTERPDVAPSAILAPQRAKFNNRKVSLDGYRFDSQAEGRRYIVLRDRLRKGEITDLAVHPSFVLSVKGVLIGRYTPDFAYTVVATKERVVEDVKSKATITEAYRLRKKLMWACHKVRVVEVLAA